MSHNGNSQMTGGFFGFGSGCSKNNEVLLKAYSKEKFELVFGLIEHNMITDFGYCDCYGNTILHHSVAKDDTTFTEHLMQYIDVKIIDKQNNNGDTALHVAVKHRNEAIADILIANGADVTIKNNNGEYVADASVAVTLSSQNNASNKPDNVGEAEFIKLFGEVLADQNKSGQNGYADTEITITINSNKNKNILDGDSPIDSFDKVLDDMMTPPNPQLMDKQLMDRQSMNGQPVILSDQMNTEELIDALRDQYDIDQQEGGAQKIVTGNRQLESIFKNKKKNKSIAQTE
jgi:hypothetical protein